MLYAQDKQDTTVDFYRLTSPKYKSNSAEEQANLIAFKIDMSLPGRGCPFCGPWAGSRRLYLPVHDAKLQRKLRTDGWPLPDDEWLELARAVHKHLNLKDDFPLLPGDDLGTPVVDVYSSTLNDFLHPFPGVLVVKPSTLHILEEEGFTGFRPIKLNTHWSKRLRHLFEEPPELYELLVTGQAWREGNDKESLILCQHCGRMDFPKWTPVDESRWDGSDFFNVDCNPNIVLVTKRVCKTLSQHNVTNYRCVPYEELATSLNQLLEVLENASGN